MNKARKDEAPTFVTDILRVTKPQDEELEPEGRIILIGTSNAGRVLSKLNNTYNVEYIQVMTVDLGMERKVSNAVKVSIHQIRLLRTKLDLKTPNRLN